MSYALGQPVPLRALVRDSDGVLSDATTVVLTITLPDGTTATPSVTNPPAVTGTYEFDYTPTLPGLHPYRWVFTGTNASAPPLDSFYVDPGPTGLAPLASLAEARHQCRLTSTAEDSTVQLFLRVASNQCERRTQLWRRQTLTKTADGGAQFVRLKRPIISVTTVTEGGTTVAASGWTAVLEDGLLYRGGSTWRGMRWARGQQNIVVTYVGGPSDGLVPDEIRQGVLLLTEHLWSTQRGAANLPRKTADTDWTLPAGFTIPNAVVEQWSPWIRELTA